MSSHKLLLFDIDGTLVLSGGVPQRILVDVIAQEFGREIDWSRADFAGSTDGLIVQTLMRKNRLEAEYPDQVLRRVLDRYLQQMREALREPGVVRVLPGVAPLLQSLADAGFSMGLVTGNLEGGARAKLQPPDLNRFFPIGAYGSDATDRNLLPPLALQRAGQEYGRPFEQQDVWIIGDTPNDIACARANGLRCLAVATGMYKEADLCELAPDRVLPDLVNTAEILNLLLTA